MDGVIVRLIWFTCVSIVISYGSYLYIGSVVSARASRALDPIVVRDVLGPGSHTLSGMIMVPTPCDQLSLNSQALSTTTFMLDFRTWREPSVDCPKMEVPRSFHAVLFAPSAGVTFGATLDGAGQPIVVLPVTPITVDPL